MPSSCPSSDKCYLLAAGLCAVLLAPLAAADEIIVITDSRHPVEVLASARTIELDRPEYLNTRLATDLPTDPAQCRLLVQQRLKDGSTYLQQELGLAYQDLVDAWTLGINKIPAVVVDRHFVVYGEPDVGKAVALIEAHRRVRP